MLFRLYQILRFVYYPFFNWVFPLFSSSLAARIKFEKRNEHDSLCLPFAQKGERADVAFEVSSEGELEQIRPVITAALDSGQKVELIFASESVEKQCCALALRHSSSLRVLRYPLVTYLPGRALRDPLSWLSAPKLFLCRYDFFPELLRYGNKNGVEFVLLSGSLKSFERKTRGAFYTAVYQKIYRCFDKIVAATNTDKERFVRNFGASEDRLAVFDFRPLAIQKRLDARQNTFRDKFPAYDLFMDAIGRYPIEKRIVFGSFWASELEAFDRSIDFKEYAVCLFPHRLDGDSLGEITSGLAKKVSAPVYVMGDDQERNKRELEGFSENPGPLVLALKGVLCESYPDFGAAFVGGGHGLSVHSLMEPFMGGCKVLCGPKVHRSTEYDLIMEMNPDRLGIVDSLEDVFKYFIHSSLEEASDLGPFRDAYIDNKESLLKWLGINIKQKE